MHLKITRFISAVFTSALLLSITLQLSGCVTGAILDKPNKTYKDTFSSVLLSADEKTLVVISSKYHYVFPAPPQLVSILKSPIHKSVTANFFSFKLSRDNSIEGDIRFCFPPNLKAADVEVAKKIGFSDANLDSNSCKSEKLSGVRYAAGKIAITDNYKLNKAYNVEVSIEPGVLDKGAKLALTPIAMAIDGTLIIAGSPLILLYIIAVYNSGAPLH